MKHFAVWALLMALVSGLCACSEKPCEKSSFLINGFETDGDLDRLNWKCRTLFALSDKGVTQGRSSLELTMTPSLYPGVSFRDYPRSWSCFSALGLSVFNPGSEAVTMTLRIDDKEEEPEYEDRVNLRIVIGPGMNRIRIPFHRLVCPSGRKLDTDHVFSLMFFCVSPPAEVVLYLDDLRLGDLVD